MKPPSPLLRAPRNSIDRQQIIGLHGGGEKGVVAFVVFIMNRDVQIHFLLPVRQDDGQDVSGERSCADAVQVPLNNN